MADKKFTLTFDVEGNLSPIKGAVKDFQSTIKSAKFQIPVGIQGNIDKTISKLNAEIAEFESLTSQGFSNMADIGKAEKSFAKITSLMRQLGSQGEQIKGLDPKKFLPKEILERTAKLEKAFGKLGDIKVNTKKIDAQTEAVKKQKEEVDELRTKYEALAAENKTAGARKGNLSSSIKTKEKELEAIQQQMKALEQVKGGKSSAEYSKLNSEFKTLSKTISAQKQEFASLDTSINKNKTTMSGLKVQLDSASSALDQMEESLKQLQASANVNEDLENLRKELAQLKSVNIDEIPDDLDEIKRIIGSLDDDQIKTIKNSLEGMGRAADALAHSLEKTSEELEKAGQEGKELTRVGQEIENLKSQVLDFFSITNTIQIFKNAVRDAFDTVKELDAVMTETAVVTDFSIGDMWDKLPEYAEQANKLGASIKDLYAANTLYYQQGLNSQQAMSVGVETMKMARIANMDAAQATEAMTAALRGFNMEINETSAGRINDVYSELAAITASDTEQIATAMSKTASIAASANMEFETTAALLAQIIETTQEAPETAGTAMKTIIARFTEVKELFSEGMLSGEDAEGEEININKIDKALKTVGISLKDFLNGSKGIDDIFLELASKWDSLDLATQRYIATTAAGSRQQSRFIAMMSNYGRTMELVNAANNSAGASQKQFDKTTESLEAKIQRLKNAWAEFTMGLANNSLIKTGVDLLTDLLTTINSLTDAGDSKIGKFITSLLRLGTVLIGLKGGQSAINGILKFLTNTGITEILGMKGMETGKVDFFVAIKKAITGLGESLSKTKNNFIGALEILKDPAWRGEILKSLGTALGKIGKTVLGFLKTWGGWIALIIGVTLAIKTMVTAFNEAQKAAKMEKLQESMSKLTEEAEEAKSELNEISNSRKNLENLEDTLNDLTKGTNEWKQSLIAVNQEVLRLIDQYPELGKYVTTGQNGQLSIDSKGWDEVYSQQLQLVTNISGLQNTTTAQIKELQAGMEFDNFVIELQDEGFQQNLTEFEIGLNDWMDSTFKLFGKEITWGEILSSFADGAATMYGMGGTPNSDLNREIRAQGGYQAYYQKQRTGGLADLEETDLAAAFAEAGVTMADGLSDSELKLAQEIYSDLNYDPIFMDAVINKAKELGQAFDDLGNKSLSLVLQEERASKNFVRNAVFSAEELSNIEYGDAITEFLAGVKNYEDLTAEIKEEKQAILSKSTSEDLMAQYAEKYGKYYADGKLYTDSSMSTQIEGLSDEWLANAIASANITIKVKEDALQIAQTSLKGKNTELFDDLFSANGSEISSKQVVKYSKEEGYNFDQVAMDMGFASLEDMATQLETTIEDLTKTLTENFESATDRIAKQRRDLTRQMSKYSSKDSQDYEINANILAGLEEKFGEQIRFTLENVIGSLEMTGDDSLISSGYEYFRDVALSGNQKDVEQLSEFIDSIDWTDPINGAYKLNQAVSKGSEITRGFAETILSVDEGFLSSASQFETFFNSDVYKDMGEDLHELLEVQGEITETDVRSLASEYSYLNKLLKNTSTTAEGLATILTSLEEGELTFEGITDAVIAAIGSMDTLGEATSAVIAKLQELEFGDDLGEVQDFYSKWGEKLTEIQQEGGYGGPELTNFLDYVYGSDWDKGLVGDEAIIAREDELIKRYQDILGKDMYYAWESAAKGINIFGQEIDESVLTKLDEAGIKLDYVNGKVAFEVPDDMTFDQVSEKLQEVFGGSKQLWDDLMTYFSYRSPEFQRTWQLADYNQMGKRIAESETNVVEGKKFVTSEEVETIAAEAQIKYNDKDVETIKTELTEQLSQNEVEILTILDTEDIAAQANDLVAQLDSIFGGTDAFAGLFTSIENGVSSLDFTALMQAVGSLPISEELAAQISNGVAQSIAEAGGQITYEIEGETRTLDLDLVADGTSFTDAVNAEIAAAEEAAEQAELDSTATVTIDQAAWQASVNSAKSYIGGVLSGLRYPVKAYVSEVDTSAVDGNSSGSGTSGSSSSTGTGKSNLQPILKSAKGTINHPRNELSLTGEEGPELIETRNGAYLVGTEGPQMTYLKRGDTVHTAEETAEIYKRQGKVIPAFKGGAMGPAPGLATGSGGKSSDSDEETWENPFDKLYNLVRKIDEELRARERIERRYEKLLTSIDTSANKIIAVSREELAQLERERMLQESLVASRKSQISQYQSENADLSAYANVVQNERGESVLRINWDLIDQVTDPDKGARIEEYVSQMEEWFDFLEEAEDALWDIEDAVEEIKERGKEEYFELEDAIKEALAQSYQDEIDKLSEINESINDTNSELLDAMQKTLDKQRQDRENQRTEDDLAEKQRRLLYLQQDTSGANAMEILQLQKEIEEGQEDYTDTLIDQKISELQQQNDEAAKQREQQITLLQAQLDHYIKNGQLWQDVYALMEEGLDKDSGLVRGSRLEELLKSAEGYAGMSEIAKMEWMNDTNNMIAQALAYLEIGRQLEDIGTKAGSQIEFTTSDGRVLTGIVNDDGSVIASDGQTYNNVFQGYDGKYYAGENIADVEEPVVESPGAGSGGGSSSSGPQKKNNPYGTASDQGYYTARNGTMWSSGVKAIQWALNDMGYNAGSIDGGYGYATAQAVQRFQRAEGIQVDGDYGPQTREKMRLRGYKTGGLADFTGPAWLDGTKARPELVLSARDTQNFIQLKDILASVMERGSTSNTSTENNGDITYDIDINVESIGSDYDVEQVANKVKSMIGENARYRNNNTVSLAR